MYVRTNRRYNERSSRTNYVRSSIAHCISLCFICTSSRQATIVSPLKWNSLPLFHRHDPTAARARTSIHNRTFTLGSTTLAQIKSPCAVSPLTCRDSNVCVQHLIPKKTSFVSNIPIILFFLALVLFTDDDFLVIPSTSTIICGQKSIHGKSSVATPKAIYNNVSADKKFTNIQSSKAGTDTDCTVGS